jgi:GTP cyclohydrolase II
MKKQVSQKLLDLVENDKEHSCAGYGPDHVCVRAAGVADLPTKFGHFNIIAFWNNRDEKDHIAIVHGEVVGMENVPVRLHSECLTGDALGSLRCDCRDQLTVSLERIAEEPFGIVLYLRQEGRGIGLLNKIRAYQLQDGGLDTVEANLALGFRDDERDFAVAAHMLHSLGIKSVRLMTNNPKKVDELRRYQINVVDRLPHIIPSNEHNRFYLETKSRRSGHWIDFEGYPHLPEQADAVQVSGMDSTDAE